MSDVNTWLTGFAAGSVLSFCYFWGLWATVHRLKDALHPVGFYTTSLVLRVTLLGIALAFLLSGGWQQLFAAAIAFFVVRFAVVFAFARPSMQTVN